MPPKNAGPVGLRLHDLPAGVSRFGLAWRSIGRGPLRLSLQPAPRHAHRAGHLTASSRLGHGCCGRSSGRQTRASSSDRRNRTDESSLGRLPSGRGADASQNRSPVKPLPRLESKVSLLPTAWADTPAWERLSAGVSTHFPKHLDAIMTPQRHSRTGQSRMGRDQLSGQ